MSTLPPQYRIVVREKEFEDIETAACELSLHEKHGAYVNFHLQVCAEREGATANLDFRGNKSWQLEAAVKLLRGFRFDVTGASLDLSADWRFPEEDQDTYEGFKELDLPTDINREEALAGKVDLTQPLLNSLLRQFRLSREELALKLGSTVEYLAKLLNGSKALNRAHIRKLMDQLPLSIDLQAALTERLRLRERIDRRHRKRKTPFPF